MKSKVVMPISAKKGHFDPVTGKEKVHRYTLPIPHHLWQALQARKVDTGTHIRTQILDLLEQTLE